MNPSASKLELFEACAAVGGLPAVRAESTDDQAAGTGRHAFVELLARCGREEALAAIPEGSPWRACCEGLDPAEIPVGRHEIAYAYDCASDAARELGPWLGRAYDCTATEISGTNDLVCEPSPGHPRWRVIDWKGEDEVTATATNLQLGFYALCVARVHQLDEIDVAIGYIGHAGAIRWDRATLGPFELEAVAARVREVHARTSRAQSGAPADFTVGLHCRRCSALPLCPAQVALVSALAREERSPADLAASLAPLSDERAGEAWERLKLFKEHVKAIEASLRARAEVKGLPLPNGDRLMPRKVFRRSIDVEKALPVLREKFGAQADEAVERRLPAEEVTRLSRQLAPGKGQKKALDALWSDLTTAGAVSSSMHTELRVKKAKPPAGGAAIEGESALETIDL